MDHIFFFLDSSFPLPSMVLSLSPGWCRKLLVLSRSASLILSSIRPRNANAVMHDRITNSGHIAYTMRSRCCRLVHLACWMPFLSDAYTLMLLGKARPLGTITMKQRFYASHTETIVLGCGAWLSRRHTYTCVCASETSYLRKTTHTYMYR